MSSIYRGPVRRAQRTVIYGPEGVGKSTFASLWPNPVYIDTESGTDHLDVARFAEPKDWTELLGIVDEIFRDPQGFETLVVDTADGAEALCRAYILKRDGQKSIESYGYGKGYTIAQEEWQKFLDSLSALIDGPHPVNVVVCAHSQQRKVEKPEDPNAYDHYELKLDRRIAAVTKEWADAVLFMNFETFVVENSDGHHKAKGGKKRRLYTDHDAAFDAKNRWGLPDSIALEDAWALIEPHVTNVPKPSEAVVAAAEAMGAVEEMSPRAVASAGAAPTPVSHPQVAKPAAAPPQAPQKAAEPVSAPKAQPDPEPAPAAAVGPSKPTPQTGETPRLKLRRLMHEGGINESEIRYAMSARGYRPIDCPVSNYPDELVAWMVSDTVWPGLSKFIADNSVPF